MTITLILEEDVSTWLKNHAPEDYGRKDAYLSGYFRGEERTRQSIRADVLKSDDFKRAKSDADAYRKKYEDLVEKIMCLSALELSGEVLKDIVDKSRWGEL